MRLNNAITHKPEVIFFIMFIELSPVHSAHELKGHAIINKAQKEKIFFILTPHTFINRMKLAFIHCVSTVLY
ncbi:hypothetical protein LFZ18_10680 [Salmonella enterica subsp. enterica serovar Itami str. SA20014991]|nr:hypothetical protein LFZ18_10680 [Salmonella enterica subsp. enterica serovar Itami str. SA20014991]